MDNDVAAPSVIDGSTNVDGQSHERISSSIDGGDQPPKYVGRKWSKIIDGETAK